MELDHKSLIKFYTKCIILSTVREGDSLSKLQLRTRLSFTTVHKTINELEKFGIIKTKANVTSKGKVKEIIYISRKHVKYAKEFLNKLETTYYILESESFSNTSRDTLLKKRVENTLSLDNFC